MTESASHRAVGGPRHRTVFMGTPKFAVPTLTRLLEAHDVVGVFTQPDRPAGRGRRVRSSPVKRMAEKSGAPVFQPKSFRRDPSAIADLAALQPEIVVVAAYRLLLTPEVLDLPTHGALNVHASLLPRWRGAAPVTYSLLEGDPQTGATIMLIDEGLDTGPMLSRGTMAIAPDATAGSLTEELSVLGAELLIGTLPQWVAGEIEPEKQDDSLSTYAPVIERADAALDWRLNVDALERRVRAMNPWPGAYTYHEGAILKVHASTALPKNRESGDEGLVVATGGGLGVVAGDGLLQLDQVQPAGGRSMSGDEFARGRPEFVGSIVGQRDGGDAC